MTQTTTSTTYNHTTTAQFNAWANEIYTALVTTCGLTQSADSGQMAVPTTSAIPGINTAAGYWMFNFNDALQATAPVYIKMEFGTGGTTTTPAMWMTVGSATNGAGTITTNALFRSTISVNNAIASTITAYVSRFVYNATQGVLGMSWKIGSYSGNFIAMGGFYIYRSVNAAGAPTGDSLHWMSNQINATSGSASSAGPMQVLNYDIPAVYTGGSFPIVGATSWCPATMFGNSTFAVGTNAQVIPAYQITQTATAPGFGITNACAVASQTDWALGATANMTILGATSLTYINAGGPFGNGIGAAGAPGSFGFIMLWQ